MDDIKIPYADSSIVFQLLKFRSNKHPPKENPNCNHIYNHCYIAFNE